MFGTMSRGFVKEDDQEEAPFIPPRAPLPPDGSNPVTARGLRLLHEERAALEAESAMVPGSEMEQRRAFAVINGKMALLNERIGNARPIEDAPPYDQVRFGHTVSFRIMAGPQAGVDRVFTLVGVDEANVKEGRIAWTAPIARTLIGARVGDLLPFALGSGTQTLRIDRITGPEE